jgi:hypothetical protein
VSSVSVRGPSRGRRRGASKPGALYPDRRETWVHFSRSLCANISGKAWRVAGIGLRGVVLAELGDEMCWIDWVGRQSQWLGVHELRY